MTKRFHSYLTYLGFTEEELRNKVKDGKFNHSVDRSISIKYIYTPTRKDIFKAHQLLWNANEDFVFVAVSDNQTYLINAKEKPDSESPLKKSILIDSFEYGVDNFEFENIDQLRISKAEIDSGYFFDFVAKHQRKAKNTVDKDLLLNLLHLKSDLVNDDNREVVHLLILRCLFIKYLEDRGIFDENYLVSVLESGNPKRLTEAFDRVARINGDVFKYDSKVEPAEIHVEYLTKLEEFFKSDYRLKQQRLFPYRFDQIPIQLISHVYEAFLKESLKKGDGIYYTPEFLVDFMLSNSFKDKLLKNPKSTIFDPAVGSGAFLVHAFKMIEEAHGGRLDFEAKKKILQTQLYGVDVDRKALQIAAFSLYLALLENEETKFIRDKIERASPILPSLIGHTLLEGNSLLEDKFPNRTFDCIASNPPWGAVPKRSENLVLNEVYKKERNAIRDSSNYPEYRHVAYYERSQAFLTRVSKWGNADTLFVMVVKNSVFLNDKADKFRRGLLNRYAIDTFYELSHYNPILFKKSSIGEVYGEKVELGASEPCAVLIFRQLQSQEHLLTYASPKLTSFGQHFELIHSSDSDTHRIAQSEFTENDSLWRILVNGDFDGYDLIANKLLRQKDLMIEARSGFKAEMDMDSLGEPVWKDLIKPTDFEQFVVKNPSLEPFNWNQKLERRRELHIFQGSRMLLPVRPVKSDNILIRGVFLEKEVVHTDNTLSVKLKKAGQSMSTYTPYLGILNSSLLSYVLFQLSVQWGKGEGKREKIRNTDVEDLPFKQITDESTLNQMTKLVETIQTKKADGQSCERELNRLNEMVFDFYGLLDYEKEIIKEFYDVRVKRADPREWIVRDADIKVYSKAFADAFSLILSQKSSLNVSYNISSNLGAIVCFSIVNEEAKIATNKDLKLEILNLVKSKQMESADSVKILFEEKVKIYDKDKFYIVKSNQFKDWTVRQAIKDVKEEVEAIFNQLPSGK